MSTTAHPLEKIADATAQLDALVTLVSFLPPDLAVGVRASVEKALIEARPLLETAPTKRLAKALRGYIARLEALHRELTTLGAPVN